MNQQKLGPRAGNPTLSKRSLTLLLIGLAVIPSVVTVGLRFAAPRVKEGELPVSYAVLDMPGDEYYQLPAESRQPLDDPRIEIRNDGDGTLENFNLMINHSHEIRDPQLVLEPGETMVFRLKRFYNRAGVPFVPELGPVTHLRVFAKQADKSRASLDHKITHR